jgi:hypothetical protein
METNRHPATKENAMQAPATDRKAIFQTLCAYIERTERDLRVEYDPTVKKLISDDLKAQRARLRQFGRLSNPLGR